VLARLGSPFPPPTKLLLFDCYFLCPLRLWLVGGGGGGGGVGGLVSFDLIV
jgi:hypothetical protein